MGCVDISVRCNLRADPYFSFSHPNPPVGWQKAWFLLRNEADAPLHAFTGGRPIPHPNWEHGVAQTDFPMLQPLLKIIWGLL
jgi:hypothetical protein